MALHKIRQLPDPALRLTALPVTTVDDAIRTLIDDLFETMYAHNGIGLAATQIGVLKRVVVINLSRKKAHGFPLVNPVITKESNTGLGREGCLSVGKGKKFGLVKRAKRIKIAYADREGELQTMKATGLMARCIQHEIDHLDGKLFVDYLPQKKGVAT